MKSGFWINYATNEVFLIDEHETWLRSGSNASKLRVPKEIQNRFKEFKNRDKFLLFVLFNAPVMRVRGHGSYWTFEFSSKFVHGALDSIYEFCKDRAGEFTKLYINNFAKKDTTELIWGEFEKLYTEDKTIIREDNTTKMIIVKKFSEFFREEVK